MKISVAVLFGGVSVEHEISVISALQAIDAMDKEKYEVTPVYITKSGVMLTGEALLSADSYKDMEKLYGICKEATLGRCKDGVYLTTTKNGLFGGVQKKKIDVAFPVVHGTNCEDGSLQGFLETLRIPYVGSDVLASAIGMDKIIMKQILKDKGIPVVDYVDFPSRKWLTARDTVITKIEKALPYPVIVKPANLGSSVGIKKAANRAALIDAVDLACSFSMKIIIEHAVTDLLEINCSVLGNANEANASVCEQPVQSDEILSYTDKYVSGNSKKGSIEGSKGMSSAKRKCPADIDSMLSDDIRKLAVDTFKVLGASGVARIDFLIDQADGNKVYVNEINTIPGSLSFYLWEATGKSFTQLCSDMIDLAFKRERDRANLMFTYDKNIFALGGGYSGKK